ncbi:MAG: hypothetical protein ABI623_11030 [bacterium]
MKTQKKQSAKKYFAMKVVFLFLLLSSASFAQVAVIVNKSVPIKSAGASTILDIYNLSSKEWSDGTQIIVIVLKNNEETAQKFYEYLGTRPLTLKKIWMRAQLSGECKAPTSFSSEEEVVAKVASTPGAIGFVHEQYADSSVQTIAIIE